MASESRKESWRRYGRKRRKDPAYREKQREYQRRYQERHKDDAELKAKKAAAMRKYNEDPQLRIRQAARRKVRHEIAMGRLLRLPCQVCGKTDSQAHHEDYSKPLDVVWLCRKHHQALHTKATGQ